VSISVLLQPAPGWYPDPAGQATYRWWDGDGWTEGTHAEEPLQAPAQGSAPTVAAEPIQLFADPEPVAPAPAAQPQPVVRRTAPAKTRWSSLLLAFPFLYPFAIGMVVALAYAGGAATNPVALVVIGGVVAVAALIPAWVFAEYDRRELRARGYQPAPSIGWMAILPPIVYLIVRRRVVGPSY